jgi:hypothetical protein
MAARDEAYRKAEARGFTDQVDALVSATLRGYPPPADASDDAVQLAAGFLLLDRLVSQYAMLCPPAIGTAEGVHAAQWMLLCLRSGYDHPLWTYISGVRTKHRMNRKAAPADLRRRAYSVGLMRALEEIYGSTARAAAKALSELDYFRRLNVTEAALRKWPAELQEPAALDSAALWFRTLHANAKNADDAMRHTVTALEALEEMDRTPSLVAAARMRPAFVKLVDQTGRLVAEVEVRSKK